MNNDSRNFLKCTIDWKPHGSWTTWWWPWVCGPSMGNKFVNVMFPSNCFDHLLCLHWIIWTSMWMNRRYIHFVPLILVIEVLRLLPLVLYDQVCRIAYAHGQDVPHTLLVTESCRVMNNAKASLQNRECPLDILSTCFLTPHKVYSSITFSVWYCLDKSRSWRIYDTHWLWSSLVVPPHQQALKIEEIFAKHSGHCEILANQGNPLIHPSQEVLQCPTPIFCL